MRGTAPANPQDTAALAELVQLHYQAGSNQIEVDRDTGTQSLTEEGEQQLAESADAWDRYLKQTQKSGAHGATLGVSSIAVQTFSVLAASLHQALTPPAPSARSRQRCGDQLDRRLHERGDPSPSPAGWAGVRRSRLLLYRSGDIAGGDQASAQAAHAAAHSETSIEQQLKQTKKQGEQLPRRPPAQTASKPPSDRRSDPGPILSRASAAAGSALARGLSGQ